MRDFRIILGYELRQQLMKKSAIITTVVLILAALIGTSIPRIQASFGSKADSAPVADSTLVSQVGYVFESPAQRDEYSALLNLNADNAYASRDALVTALKYKLIQVGFVLRGDSGFEAIYQDKGLDARYEQRLSQVMSAHHREKQLALKGLTVAEFTAIEQFQPDVTLTVMGKTTENNMLVSMILMIMVYILVLLYGNITSVIIAREKDSKAMELLITSTKPTALIFGKVAAAGISGVVQFGSVILCALGGFLFNQEYYSPLIRQMLLGSLSTGYVLSYLFFAIIGYLLYLFVFAALGSTVSRVEDVSSATAIVQVIMILGYVATSFVISDPHGTIARFTSLFPFTSIIVMPMRVGLTTVPPFELILSGILMMVTVALFAWLSIKIYRWGSLNYGNKTNIFKVLRSVFAGRKKAA